MSRLESLVRERTHVLELLKLWAVDPEIREIDALRLAKRVVEIEARIDEVNGLNVARERHRI